MSAEMMFVRSGMGYVGAWDRHGGVEIALDHIRRRSGELHGEVVISSAAVPTARGKLHRAAFNVSSTTSRDRLAKTLTERGRGSGDIPWKHLVEEFCTAVLEAERTGAPIVRVGTLPPEPNTGFLVDPLLPSGKTTIIFAAGGTGKSYLAVLVSAAVQSGTDVLGWKVRRTNVLYLDWETDAYEVDRRLKRVGRGLGLDDIAINYRACAGPIDEMAESLSGYITDNGIGFVVVDSAGMASGGGRENGPAEDSALRMFGALRHLGATVLLIDHVTGDDVKSHRAVDKPYGSIYKVNLARSVYELKGTPVEGQDAHMALFHRKVNGGALVSPLGIRISHGDDVVTFHREDIQDAGLVTGLSVSTRIRRLLAAGSMAVADIADQLEVGEGTVRVTLNRGAQGGTFVKLTDGTWGNAVP